MYITITHVYNKYSVHFNVLVSIKYLGSLSLGAKYTQILIQYPLASSTEVALTMPLR
jgi:hypothetical protein